MRVPSSSSSSSGAANGRPVLPMVAQDTQHSSASDTQPLVVDVEEESATPMEVEPDDSMDPGMEGQGGAALSPTAMTDAPGGQPPRDTSVPVLMIAEQHPDGANDAQDIILQNYMERGYALESMALEARAEFESALQGRGGQ